MQQAPGAPESVDDVVVGALLDGRYRLERRIGAGGMARIYLARDEKLGRAVAVKVLHGHLADDETVQRRFREEARHAARLNHPHIVGVFDQGSAEVPYIVMEHVDGPSLREVLNLRGPLRPAEALSVVAPIAAALAKAHDARLIHRDIKPENVLITDKCVPKIADFGIARALEATNHTVTGSVVGSVHYLAPELVRDHPASPASDQYALGVVLFELLTARKALPAETQVAVLLRHRDEPVPSPSRFTSAVGRELDEVVKTATAMAPGDRYPDMLAFASALADAVPGGGEPVRVTDPGQQERTLVLPLGDLPRPSPAAEVTVVNAGRPSRTSRRPKRRGRRGLLIATIVLLLLGLLAGGSWATWNYVLAPVRSVPDVTRMAEAGAAEELAALGLDMGVTARPNDLDVPDGTVMTQEPPPGAQLRSGEGVGVTVSSGPAAVTMPNILDPVLQRDEARALLEGGPYYFTVVEQSSYSDIHPAGVVAGQLPDSGDDLRQGDEVTINVSLGVEQVTVPALAGLTREQAEQALIDAKLEANITGEYSDEQPEQGAVIRQSVPAAETVDKGTVVEVVVSLGTLTVAMPNVVNQPVADASAELEALGLQVQLESDPVPMLGPFITGRVGIVEFQDPEPETPLQRGDSVILYFYHARD